MSALWTSAAIADASGGTENGAFDVSGVSIDTRSLQKGDLFVPLKDARDGHDFMDQAFKAGAAGALSERETNHPHIRVANTMAALEALGQAGRDRSNAKRIAVTGSVGKTSVKDALAVMLGEFGKTHKSQRSFNNHYGVPITLATLPPSADFAVLETGMNHSGELTELSQQVAPHVALITTVEAAHIGNFGSIEDIADAKAEIREGLVPGGTLILNGDNPHTPRIIAQSNGLNITTFGRGGDVKIVSSSHHATGGIVELAVMDRNISVELNVAGQHWAMNAAACLAVGHALELDLIKAAKALSKISASSGRGDVQSVTINGKSVTLIDESYNANPASMRAAISAASLRPGRKVAVLGDMYELGANELALHAALAGPLEEADVSRVITVGECMRALRGALPRAMRGPLCSDINDVKAAFSDEIQDGDVLLIKGSNATGLSKLASELKRGGL